MVSVLIHLLLFKKRVLIEIHLSQAPHVIEIGVRTFK